jgi:hypothetical protein
MVEQIPAGGLIRPAHAPALSARAVEPVADDAHRADVQGGIVAADTDGHDPASVEHVRQSRLSRWQEQRESR